MSHLHIRRRGRRSLFLALGMTATYMLVEVAGAFYTNSLALLADAGHMLTDVASLGLALGAMWLAARPASFKQSYGYHRAEVLAAFLNGVFLWLIVAYIFYQAYQRFLSPPEVKSLPMLAIGSAGLLVNIAAALALRRSAAESLNVMGAFLHVLGDLLGSLGVMVAGVLMLAFGWFLADPIFSVLIGIIIAVGSARLIWRSTHVLLEGTPPEVNLPELEQVILQVEGVQGVHDLHAWMLTSGYNAMSAHVILERPLDARSRKQLLSRLQRLVYQRFPIHHATIQMEEEAEACEEGHTMEERA